MSKKSVRSQGYRTQKKKTTGYTPQEKKIMIIGFAVIALVIICLLVVPEYWGFWNLLSVKDGEVQGVGDNWLICNVGTSSNKKYRKLAEINEVYEGYELSSVEDGLTDSNLIYYIYETDDEDALATTYTIQSGSGEASELVETYRSGISAYAEILYTDDEVTETTINGKATYSFVMEYRMENTSEEDTDTTDEDADEDSDEEEEDDTTYDYSQVATVYISSSIEDKCVVVQVSSTGEDDSIFNEDREALLELALEVAATVTVQ